MNIKIGIAAIGYYIPDLRIDNIKDSARFGMSPEFVNDKIGFTRLAKKNPAQESSDLAYLAVIDLESKSSFFRKDVECLVVVSQNPDGYGIPHTSAILHNKLGLSSKCIVFDISLGCSGFVHGLSIIKSFMEVNGLRLGLLVTADPYSKVMNYDDKDTFPLFGDGASASLLTDDPILVPGVFDFGTCSDLYNAITVESTGFLRMNGRAVFNFASIEIPKSIERALLLNNVQYQTIDALVLHQGSKYVADIISKKAGMESKSVFCSAEYGNTVSSSIPIAISSLDLNVKCFIASGFGVGLSWATTIFWRIK
jgi:3-oxoacyl-[acyl-carrier-protein] synthase-3